MEDVDDMLVDEPVVIEDDVVEVSVVVVLVVVDANEEYTVTRILKHPQMSNTRLSNDIAILYVERDINLNHPYVNTACLPSCDNQFDYQFSNGTGVRCFVAGWGKDEHDGSFQFIPKKVDLPLVNDDQCEASLQTALN